MNTQTQTQTQQKPQMTEESVKIYIKRNAVHVERFIKLKYKYTFKIKLEQQYELTQLSIDELVSVVEKAKIELAECAGRVHERLFSLMHTLEKIDAEWYSKEEAEYFMFEFLNFECVKYVVVEE